MNGFALQWNIGFTLFVDLCTFTDAEACPSSPPAMKHGTAVVNTTHVTYTCDDGFAFPDSSVEKSYICGCEMLFNISTCMGTYEQK